MNLSDKPMLNITDTAECCGCEACFNICPVSAITMREDQRGFTYPHIDIKKCIDCDLCVKVCAFSKPNSTKYFTNESICYAAQNLNVAQLKNSASGGAFSAMAQYVIENGGEVWGAAWDNDMKLTHIPIRSSDKIIKLQGSKYVQSSIGEAFKKIKASLVDKTVLFCGTPCQCDGLRSFLRKDYRNLVTVELICHGVPSQSFLKAYLSLIEKKENGKIVDLKFRDKKRGWGALLNFSIIKKSGKTTHKYLTNKESYYYYYYWGGNLYRPSCYNCKYACPERKSDFTIGDFWGITDLPIDTCKGVSLILANTPKAYDLLEQLGNNYLSLEKRDISQAIKENGQLSHPSVINHDFDYLWDIYAKDGALGLEVDFKKKYRKMILYGKIKRHIPLYVIKILKRIKST